MKNIKRIPSGIPKAVPINDIMKISLNIYPYTSKSLYPRTFKVAISLFLSPIFMLVKLYKTKIDNASEKAIIAIEIAFKVSSIKNENPETIIGLSDISNSDKPANTKAVEPETEITTINNLPTYLKIFLKVDLYLNFCSFN